MALRKMKRTMSLLLSIALILGSVSFSYANSNEVKDSVIGKISIGQNSSIELKNVQMIPSNNQQTLAITFDLVNNSGNSISFYDYWLKVRVGNSVVPFKMLGTDNDAAIASGTSKSFTVYSVVNQNTKYSDVSIQFLKWDFNDPKLTDFTRNLGTIKVPATYDAATANSVISIDGSIVAISFKNSKQGKVGEQTKVEIETVFSNEGFRAVTVPGYRYYLMTSSKYVYELKTDNKTELQIQPKSTGSLKLKAYIPKDIDLKNARFIITQSLDQNKIELPLNTYKIDINETNMQDDSGLPVGSEKTVIIDDKQYAFRLDSIQQLPWEDMNIVSSIVTISNKTNEALPIPQVIGTFYLDGVELAKDSTKVVNLDNGIGIPAKESIKLSIYTKIPYAYKYSKVSLELINQIKDGNETVDEPLVSFEVPKTRFKSFSNIAIDNSYNTTVAGKAAAYKVKSLKTYTNNNTSIYEALLEVQNNEFRATDLSKLTGYFRSSNNTLYPVTISEVKDKISPFARVLLSVSAKIPTWANTNDLKLILGELDEQNQVYFSAAEFQLPGEEMKYNDGNLRNKEIYPYTFSINTINIDLSTNADVKFQYTLEKSTDYEYVPEGHSIVMELVDGDVSYTQEFAFETDLKLGTGMKVMTAQMGIEHPDLKMQQIDGFKINIYDQYKGHRNLIATRVVYSIFVR